MFILNENEKLSAKIEAHSSGGLYKNVKMSVKTADKIILLGVIVLIVLFVTAVCDMRRMLFVENLLIYCHTIIYLHMICIKCLAKN